MRVKQKYYKNNYLIGIYTDDDLETCVAVLDNIDEFAEYVHVKPEVACFMLHRVWHGVTKRVTVGKSRYLIYFINNNDF